MKTYIFKSTNNKSNNTSNSAKTMNDDFRNKILEFAPYLKKKENKKTIININMPLKPKKTYTGINIFDFASACKFLDNYKSIYLNNKDEYDFELADGTPVRIFDDEIQIGYDILDFNDLISLDSIYIPENKKKLIIDIAIKLNR